MSTTRLGLTELEASQAQKHVSVNESFNMLDGLVQCSVISASVTNQPGDDTNEDTPSDGDMYILPGGASGAAWDSFSAGDIVHYHDGAWYNYTPSEGWLAYIKDINTIYAYSDINGDTVADAYWQPVSFINLPGLGIGAAWDANNKFYAVTYSSTFTYDSAIGGDCNLIIHKNTATDDASITFKGDGTNWTTYALFGLLANNDVILKVYSDDTVADWKTAITVSNLYGSVALNQHPKFSGYCNYDQYNAAGAWFTVDINNTRHNDQSSIASGIFTAPHDGYYMFGAGVRHKTNGTVPVAMYLGFSINAVAPTADRTTQVGGTIDDYTSLNLTTCLSLSATDTVRVQAYFLTNDAYLDADYSYFWGAQVA